MKKYLKLGCLVVVLGVAGFALWLLRELWLWLTGVDPDVLATWALLVTLALPVMAFASWILGRREANIKVDGLDLGIEKVMGMAEKVADIRDRSAAKIKQQPVQIAVLPQLQQGGVVHRELTSGEDQRVIDL
jgi:H+/Cl- antiporter ClcA